MCLLFFSEDDDDEVEEELFGFRLEYWVGRIGGGAQDVLYAYSTQHLFTSVGTQAGCKIFLYVVCVTPVFRFMYKVNSRIVAGRVRHGDDRKFTTKELEMRPYSLTVALLFLFVISGVWKVVDNFFSWFMLWKVVNTFFKTGIVTLKSSHL